MGTTICRTCHVAFVWKVDKGRKAPIRCAEHRGTQIHRQSYFREYARKPETKAKRKAWREQYYAKPENRERLNAAERERNRQPEVRFRKKITKLAWCEARERGVSPRVVLAEWRA